MKDKTEKKKEVSVYDVFKNSCFNLSFYLIPQLKYNILQSGIITCVRNNRLINSQYKNLKKTKKIIILMLTKNLLLANNFNKY